MAIHPSEAERFVSDLQDHIEHETPSGILWKSGDPS